MSKIFRIAGLLLLACMMLGVVDTVSESLYKEVRIGARVKQTYKSVFAAIERGMMPHTPGRKTTKTLPKAQAATRADTETPPLRWWCILQEPEMMCFYEPASAPLEASTRQGANSAATSNIPLLEQELVHAARYTVYQGLISQGSCSLPQVAAGAPEGEGEALLCPLHGRADVTANAETILAQGGEYLDVPPILVAAAIAEQASDVERLFGLDVLEKTVLQFPGKDNMSIGIAQLRPAEAQTLGLGAADLFDPEVAVRGMYAKIQQGNQRIDQLQDPAAPLSRTDRYMLLSLAQNNASVIEYFFELDGDWGQFLLHGNNARVMRYYLTHLDWLVANGWTLPEGVDLARWRQIVFSDYEGPQ